MRVATVLLLFAAAVGAIPQQQQPIALPPHLLRQYLAQNQQNQQSQHRPEATPIYERQPEPQQNFVRVQPKEQLQPQPQYVQQYVQQQQQPQYAPKAQATRPASLRPEEQLPEDYDPNPSYQFGFDVNDDQYTNYQNRQEERVGGVIKGSYSVVDSDGFIRTVTYTADPKEGFKAEVVRQPTDIKVKVPVPTTASPLERPDGLRHRQAAQYLQASAPAPQPQQYYRYQQQQ